MEFSKKIKYRLLRSLWHKSNVLAIQEKKKFSSLKEEKSLRILIKNNCKTVLSV